MKRRVLTEPDVGRRVKGLPAAGTPSGSVVVDPHNESFVQSSPDETHLWKKRISATLLDPLTGHVILYASGKIAPAACALMTIALLSRALSRDEFGRFALTSSLALFWANIGSAWLAQGVIRFQSRFGSPRAIASYSAFLGRARWFGIGIATFGAAIATFAVRVPLVLGSAAVALAAVEAVAALVIARSQAELRPKSVVRIESAKATIGFLAVVATVILVKSPSAGVVVWVLALGELASLLVLPSRRRLVVQRPNRAPSHRLDRAVTRLMLRYGIPIGAFSLLSYAMNAADRFLLARWQGVAQAGSYAAVYDTTYRAFGLFLFPVLLGVHPMVTKAWNAGDPAKVKNALRKALLLELSVGIPLLVALGLAHERVTRYALGVSIPRSFELVVTVALAALLWQIAQLAHKPSELSGRFHVLIVGVLCALIVNLVGNTLMLRHGSMVVAGYTSALASATYLSFVLWRQKQESR